MEWGDAGRNSAINLGFAGNSKVSMTLPPQILHCLEVYIIIPILLMKIQVVQRDQVNCQNLYIYSAVWFHLRQQSPDHPQVNSKKRSFLSSSNLLSMPDTLHLAFHSLWFTPCKGTVRFNAFCLEQSFLPQWEIIYKCLS